MHSGNKSVNKWIDNAMKIDFLTWIPENQFRLLYSDFPKVKRISSLEELSHSRGDFLLSFGTSLIVPEEILTSYPLGAINIHGASPEFPGRDPHHWAAYSNAANYGATAHWMTKYVDDGEIVDVELRDVDSDLSPSELLEIGNDCAMRLIRRVLQQVNSVASVSPKVQVKWGGFKKSRKDLIEITTITPDMSSEELSRRYKAFHHPNYLNFRLEDSGKIQNLTNEQVLEMIKLSNSADVQ